jgi:hypothetical protein
MLLLCLLVNLVGKVEMFTPERLVAYSFDLQSSMISVQYCSFLCSLPEMSKYVCGMRESIASPYISWHNARVVRKARAMPEPGQFAMAR